MCLPEFCAPVPAHEDFQVAGTVVKNPPASAGDIRDVSLTPELVTFPWRRKWQPIPVLLPGEFHGQSSLVGYSLWGRKRVGPY